MSEENEVIEESGVNYEERAKLQGWVPEEEFRGDKARWIPADEFVKRADHMMPILKSVNKKLESKFSQAERELKETKETLKKIVSIQTKYQTDQYTDKISAIHEQKRQAVENADVDTYNKLEEQEKKIKPPDVLDDEPAPEAKRWMSENSWFNTDDDLTEDAVALANAMQKKGDPLAQPGREYELGEAVKAKLMKLHPDKFKNANQGKSDIDETTTRESQQKPNGKSWNNLPADAKEYWENQGQYIPGFTKEKYIKAYFEA
jgi:ElaB/YqjD/DUF883 family membrane-anchored ribosome-binding protein